MTSDSFAAKSYSNPQIAFQVIGGTIYDQNSQALSISLQKWDLIYNPDNLFPSDNETEQIAEILNLKKEDLINFFINNSTTTVLAENISYDTVSALKSINKPESLYLKSYTKREYPAGFHACQAINKIEDLYGNFLEPLPQLNQSITTGTDLKLSLDIEIQYLLDLQIQHIFNIYEAQSIQGIIQNLETGRIVAISSYPWNTAGNKPSDTEENAFEEFGADPANLVIESNPESPDIIVTTPAIIAKGDYISEFPEKSPKYLVAFSVQGEKETIFFPEFEEELEKGLVSQGKIIY